MHNGLPLGPQCMANRFRTCWPMNGLCVHWSRGWGVLSFSERLVCHYGNQSRGYLIGGRPLWPPAVPRLAARSSQSNPRGSGPEVLKRERGHVTAETGVAEVGVFRALQPNGPELHKISRSNAFINDENQLETKRPQVDSHHLKIGQMLKTKSVIGWICHFDWVKGIYCFA